MATAPSTHPLASAPQRPRALLIADRSLAAFFALAFGLSWALWLVPILGAAESTASPAELGVLFGPAVAGAIVSWRVGDRHERLPLPGDVGQALVGYLQRGRPATALDRRVFVRVKAPHAGMTTGAVSNVVSPPASARDSTRRCGRTGYATPPRRSCWRPARRWSRSANCCATAPS